ncbi:MAG: right-handed parallel beta-helix repeat-containing protein [Armatimonadetes bacterium]|nr:right-handed parallel beta-helix repeat-containing protein [Armatimonadota bacterium]
MISRRCASLVPFLSAAGLLLAGMFFVLTGAGRAVAAPKARVVYVAPNGNDAWSGRLAAANAARTDGPLARLARARDAVRQLKARPGGLTEPVTVTLRGGVYPLSAPLSLTQQDSGSEACPVSYVAYPGEQPVLSGGRAITGWHPWRGQIMCVPLPEVKAGSWTFRSLFANGRRQTRARYPNVDPTDPCRKGFLYVRRGTEHHTVGSIHNRGDTLEYDLTAPAAGNYAVWLRYTMKAYAGLADMSGHTSLAVDGGTPAPLLNLPETGSWSAYQWARTATLNLSAGKHKLRWRNDRGGAYTLAGLVLTDDPAWAGKEGSLPPVAAGKHLITIDPAEFVHADAVQLTFGLTDVEALPKGEKTTFPYAPGDAKPTWADAPDAEVHIWPAAEACRAYKQITRLEKVDEQAHAITIGGPECRTQLGIGDRYFVENVLEELDSPGEWYLDRQAGMLYYWPPQPLNTVAVTAPVTGRLVQFEGDPAQGQTLSHVRFSGLTFTQTDYAPDDGCVGYKEGSNGVIYLRGAVDCAVENCRFVSNGKAAVVLQGGRGNTISGNDISDSAEGGILVLDSAANTVSDNHIHHLGAVYKHVAGVVIRGSAARDNVVAHNLLHDITRWGVGLMETGTGNVVEYNDMYNTSLETYDTGGIHAYQNDRQFNCHTIIRYNLVHDGVGYSSLMGMPMFDSRGIYIDGFSSGYTITHNLCYRNSASGGIFIQGGHDINITNNISACNGKVQYLHTNFMENGANNEFTNNILFGTDPRIALMWIYKGGEKVTLFDHNLYCHPTGDICYPVANDFAKWQALGFDAHSIVADPGFVNPQADDYSLRPDSPALKLGFEPIDARQIGLLHPRCQCHSPRVPWGTNR